MPAATRSSLVKAVADAADTAFAHPRLSDFRRLDTRADVSIRRFYRAVPGSENEVSIYPDKHWNKQGGRVFVELFFLGAQVQQALAGCEQTWLEPDYTKPLAVLQYRTTRDAASTEWQLASTDQARTFGAQLRAFVLSTGLAWFAALATPPGVIEYLQRERRHLQLAEFHAYRGERQAARAAFANYLLACPRQIEEDLQRAVALGLIAERDHTLLARASLQHHDEYARRVGEWLGR